MTSISPTPTPTPTSIDPSARRHADGPPAAPPLTRVRACSFELGSTALLTFVEGARALDLMIRIENFLDQHGHLLVEVVTYLERIPITDEQIDGCWSRPDHWVWSDRSELYPAWDEDWFEMFDDPRWKTRQCRSIWFHASDGRDYSTDESEDGEFLYFVEYSNHPLR